MANYNGYNNFSETAELENPFADIPVMREQFERDFSNESNFSNFLQETESPFLRTYEATNASNMVSQEGEEYVNLLAELHDSEFEEMLYELSNEVEDTWRNKVSNEIVMGNNYVPFVNQQAKEYFAPMITETESMIDRVSEHFSGNNLADHSEASIQSFFETLEFNHANYSPVQEQFFGKILKKVKSIVNKGVEFAKKGIKFIGKFLPINVILNKLKGLIKPLLDKVLKFAIGKLPTYLQPYAQKFANKLLNLENEEEQNNENWQSESHLGTLQTEFDHYVSQLMFSPNESEAENTISNYEFSFESLERTNSYETAGVNQESLDAARQQFINELKNLQEGESPAPAIERFLPVAIMALRPVIKMAISLIGRQKIINFLADLLSKLVGKYVPANIAQPLSASIIDIGMSAIGFEVHETGKTDLAYEAIANTIQETVQNMAIANESILMNNEELTMNLLEAFETAAANNFPSQYIKEELRPTTKRAVWIGMPRNLPVKFYKKFTHIYDISIDTQTANAVTTWRNLPLANFLRDKYGLDTSKPIKAKVHVYEVLRKGRLSLISRFEKLPGLNAKQMKAWVQLLPLTSQASSLLLKEPSLGRNTQNDSRASRFRTKAGQRFYYLEIDGARLRIPPVNRSAHNHSPNGMPSTSIESRSGDIQAVINFVKSEIRLNYYFSEEDAKMIVEKLNKNDAIGTALSIKQSIKNVLNDILIKNISSKVKIIHEAMPELFLENYIDQQENFSPLAALGKNAGKDIIASIVARLIEKVADQAYQAVVEFFKARATEFKEAQAQPQDGVTVKLTWSNIAGMTTIKTIINAIRGNLSIGNLSDLVIPSFSIPNIKIVADKKFE